MAEEGWMTAAELANKLGASEYSVQRALLALQIPSKKDISDRRRTIYPTDCADKVRKWLESN